jgi:A/G-specific adenine glycosylase
MFLRRGLRRRPASGQWRPVRATLPESADPASPSKADAQDLLAWYERHARPLAWRIGPADRRRGVRPDPYRVWLSEVMLQQTTAKAVAPYYRRFVARWPDVRALAAAADEDVMAAWAGLGYYARARHLLAGARAVASRPRAAFPETVAELAELPGVGAYTASAIAAIAFGEAAPVADTNVERVVARLFGIEEPLPGAKPRIRAALAPLVPSDRPGEFAEGLMDLGATICTAARPVCALCPWSAPCVARRDGRQAELPRKRARKPRPLRHGVAYVARRADGAMLLRRRPPRGLLGGMCEVPVSDWSEAPPRGAPPLAAGWRRVGQPVEHVFTHFVLRLAVERAEVHAAAEAPAGCWWAPAGALAGAGLPSVMKKAVEAAFPGATEPQEGAS